MDAVKIHEWVNRYNWDDGLAPMWAIIESSQTEFATALMIYWQLGGAYDHEPCEPGSVNWEATQLRSLVRERLLSNFYSRGQCAFDPKLTKTHLYQLRKAGVPDELFLPARPDDSISS